MKAWPIVEAHLVRAALLLGTLVILGVVLAGCGTQVAGLPGVAVTLDPGRLVVEWDKPSGSLSSSPTVPLSGVPTLR